MIRKSRPSLSVKGKSRGWMLPLVAYSLLIGVYFVSRYSLQWAETDSSTLTLASVSMRDQATIHPTEGEIYPQGYLYQMASTSISLVTGLPLQQLQAIVWPLVAALGLAVSAYAFYAQITGSKPLAALAGLFLLLQPDVLFVTLRGSHEKLGRPLMMVAMVLLCKSVGSSPRKMTLYVLLFYLMVFAMVTTNVFFASTFVVAVLLSLVLGLVVIRLAGQSPAQQAGLRRLLYVSLSGGLLVYIFVAYIYPPALSNIRALRTIVEQVSVLLLGFETPGEPYTYIGFSWSSYPVYLGLTAFTWLLILFSSLEWLWRGREILRSRQSVGLKENLDWLFYAGFGIQVVVSVAVDFSGALAQNLQLRVFPGFTVLAAALLARGLQRVVTSIRWERWPQRILAGAAVAAVVWAAVASVFKATNEPLVGHKWMFYSRSENAALGWINEHIENTDIWTGLDERLREVFRFRYAPQQAIYDQERPNQYSSFAFGSMDRYVLLSERERLRGMRMGVAMPSTLGWNLFYDAGDVRVYQQRPQGPYHR